MSTSEKSHEHPPLTAGPDGDAATPCRCDARTHASSSRSGGPVVVLSVLGEIDLSTVSVLRDALDAALAGAPDHLVLDLAGVRFCGAGGHSLIADRARTAGRERIGYLVSGMSPSIARHASLLWSGPVGCHGDVDAAVSVLGRAPVTGRRAPDGPAAP